MKAEPCAKAGLVPASRLPGQPRRQIEMMISWFIRPPVPLLVYEFPELVTRGRRARNLGNAQRIHHKLSSRKQNMEGLRKVLVRNHFEVTVPSLDD
jgi:hypothetical protein